MQRGGGPLSTGLSSPADGSPRVREAAGDGGTAGLERHDRHDRHDRRDPADRLPVWARGPGQAAVLWLASRLGVMLFVVCGSLLLGVRSAQRRQEPGTWLTELFSWWDAGHYLRIADVGYLPPGLPCCDQAFFPGYPIAIRAFSVLTGGNLPWAAIAVSVLAGAVASALMWHLGTESANDPRVGANAALFLVVAPYGVFLFTVYTESLFLAFALGAWWAGTRRRWWLAGFLAALATGVRINGLFLAAALAVMYLCQLRAEGRWRPRWDVLALGAPLVSVFAFFAWLYRATGSWQAWREAEKTGWDREAAWPWEGLATGWRVLVESNGLHANFSHAADLVVTVGGVVLVCVLLALRRWPEATYIAPNVVVLICSTTLVSAPRYALLWFPAYLLAAQWSVRPGWQWLRRGAVVVCVPALCALSLLFASHAWVA